MNSQARRQLLIFGLPAVLLVVIVWAIRYELSLRKLTVYYTHAHSVVIYNTRKLDSGKKPKPVANINQSGQQVTLPKGEYTLYYTAEADYSAKYTPLTLTDEQRVTIRPAYSDAKLASILASETPAIQTALLSLYPNVSLYKIQPGKLYRNGEWYGTTLTYQGNDVFNNDTLRAVLHKVNGGWQVVSQPPDILLNKYDLPTVPLDILQDVNSQ